MTKLWNTVAAWTPPLQRVIAVYRFIELMTKLWNTVAAWTPPLQGGIAAYRFIELMAFLPEEEARSMSEGENADID